MGVQTQRQVAIECDVCHKRDILGDTRDASRAGWRYISIGDLDGDWDEGEDEDVVCDKTCAGVWLSMHWDDVLGGVNSLEAGEPEEDDEDDDTHVVFPRDDKF